MAIEALVGTEFEEGADRLTVELIIEADHCVLVLHGELCGATIAALEAQLDQLACTACHDVRVDLSGLEATDEAGLRVLAGLCHYVKGRGGEVRLEGTDQLAIPWSSVGLSDDALELEILQRLAVGGTGRPGYPLSGSV
jgi:anti-anti-sigma factor